MAIYSKTIYFLIITCACAWILIPDLYADSFYCGGRIVALGDTKREVEKKCGPPTFLDETREEKNVYTYRKINHNEDDQSPDANRHTRTRQQPLPLQKQDDRNQIKVNQDDYALSREKSFDINVEEWTYNFGSSQFVRALTFENNHLAAITTGDYGFDAKRPNGSIVELGDSKAVVWMKWGPPDDKDMRETEEVSTHSWDNGRYHFIEECRKIISIEEWFYDVNPNHLSRTLVFKGNRLVKMEPGEGQ